MLSWINGEITSKPEVSGYDRGLLLADGLFETMRVEGNRVHDFEAHMQRLSEGMVTYQLALPYAQSALHEAAVELIDVSKLQGELARLRLTLTRGSVHTPPAVLLILSREVLPEGPLNLVFSSVIRPAGNPSSRHKTLGYTDLMYAQRAIASPEDPNRLAVVCNEWGRVVCASIGNLYVLRQGTWVTPYVSEGALPGITRARLLRDGFEGMPVEEGLISQDEFLSARCLCSNVLRGVVEVQQVFSVGS